MDGRQPANKEKIKSGQPANKVRIVGGQLVTKDKIVGGQPAEKNEFPWQVALVYRFQQSPFCGGSLISSNTVLTAAHCETLLSVFRVHVGEHDVTVEDGEQKIEPSTWISHPGYMADTYDLDIAIIRLKTVVQFSYAVAPICLPNQNQNYEQRESMITGWGTTESFGPTTSVLFEVDVATITNDQCTINTLYKPEEITANMICAARPGKDSCQGDSGGPLIAYEGGGRYFSIIGVVSWGYGCAKDYAPGVYSRVQTQVEWIMEQMRGETCSRP